MDPEVIRSKLESLSRCIARIESKTPESAGALAADIDAQDIISLNLDRAVQLSADIGSHLLLDCSVPSPDSMANVFRSMGAAGILSSTVAERMAKAAGFRNLAVHEYAAMDWGIVYSIVTTRLSDFRDFSREILRIAERAVLDELRESR